jgi:hypothetical protein
MGGLAGHLMHVHEDWDLTFGDIKQIVMLAAGGQLEDCCEKVDGVNLFVTWDAASGVVKAARGKGDIAAGGLTHDDLVQKYARQPMAAQTFSHGFRAVSQGLLSLSERVLLAAFGTRGNIWYSIEILWAGNPNVIKYDGSRIIFHRNGSGERMPDGNPGDKDVIAHTFPALQLAIGRMLLPPDWRIQGSTPIGPLDMHPGDACRTLGEIDKVMSQVIGVKELTTLDEYIQTRLNAYVKLPWLDSRRRTQFIRRLMQDKSAPTIIEITKGLTKDQASTLRAINSTSDFLLSSVTEDIAIILRDFASILLMGAKSQLVADPETEANRIRDAVLDAHMRLCLTSDEASHLLATRNMANIGSLERVVAIEGIVFTYKGKTYKFTGTFAPVNQILGALRYRKPNESELVRQAITIG